jgi:pSer/pThr/pTyr-binding forkhead associated (FHA) protein
MDTLQMPDIEHQTPVILSRIAAAGESDANRMIVGIQGKGNLKVALQNEFTTIGREPDNDLQIRSRFVSRYHARIVNNVEGAIIEDLDSMNGVCVNTEKTRRRQLRSGDFIKIGRVQLQYIDITESTFCGNAS